MGFFSDHAEEFFSSSDISGIPSEGSGTAEVKNTGTRRERDATAADAKGEEEGGEKYYLITRCQYSDKINLS